MVSNWIPFCKDLPDKLEVLHIARRTGRDRHEIWPLLLMFWAWADSQTVDGHLPGMKIADLPTIIPRTDETLWNAVVAAGWLMATPDGLEIPNFGYWMGLSAKQRLQNTRRKNLSRFCHEKARPQAQPMSRFCHEKARPQNRTEQNRTEQVIPIPPSLKKLKDSDCLKDNATDKPSHDVLADRDTQLDQPGSIQTPSDGVSSVLGQLMPGEPILAQTCKSDPPQAISPRSAKNGRKRDLLFDAVAEVTASDARASAAHIGRVCKALRSAEPPYTPDEVRAWAEQVLSEGWLNGYPTLGHLEKTIGRVRAPTLPATTKRGVHRANQFAGQRYDPTLDPYIKNINPTDSRGGDQTGS